MSGPGAGAAPAARSAWELRRERGVPYIAFPALAAHSWVLHGMSTLAAADEARSGESLGAALGVEALVHARLEQVHGAETIAIGAPPEAAASAAGEPCGATTPVGRGDALVTDRPGVVLGIRVADCVPILMIDPARRVVGLAHAGWRGTLAGVGASLVRTMIEKFGCRPGTLWGWIGPSIGPECFEVGDDVRALFDAEFGAPAVPGARFVDLWRANTLSLARAGLDPARIETIRLCTVCRSDLLHSHRASGGRPGRNLVFLGIRPAPPHP